MREEIFKVTIENFSEYIKIAEKRQIKPFIKGKRKIPKKYQTEDYIWNAKNYLVHARTGDIVPSNPIVGGKPRYWRINGQDVYNQKVAHSARGGIMNKLHDMFNPYLKKIKPVKNFPIKLELNFYMQDCNKIKNKERNVDNDNRWIYEKVIQDCLRDLKIIPDDNPYYINGNSKNTIFVESPNEIKLEIIAYTD